jgi:hypothetical protein
MVIRFRSQPLLEVVVLLGDTAADVLGLGTTDVDVLEQNLGLGLRGRHGLSSSNLLADVGASLFVNLLELLLRCDLPVQNLLLKSGNRIVGGAHALNLLTGSVGGTGIGHGVTAISVGNVLKNKRTLVGSGPLLTVLDGGLDGKDVHAVDLKTRDVLTTLVVVGQGGGTSSSGTHTILVVCPVVSGGLIPLELIELTLTTEKGRKVPELGHVESLKDLTLVASTITVEDDGSVLVAVVLVSKGKAGADGDLSTDDTVTAVEALGEHVHGTTLTVGDTLTTAEQLSNDGSDRGATHQSVAVASVGSDDIVLLGDGMLNTNGNSLLSGGQMAETTDLLLLVQTIGRHLHLSAGLSVKSIFNA